MNMRKITSMTLVWSLVILILNSIVLYVVPEGRVSYWADWRFLGLTKAQWGDQHTTVGFLFLFAGLLHIYYNWTPILGYMKNKAKELKVFTGPSNIGLILTAVFVIGTYFNVPPMSTIVDISAHFKDAAADKYGEPPYGHAETSSLKMFTKREQLDLEKSKELLSSAGVKVDSAKVTIKEIAKSAGLTPQQVYEIIKPAKKMEEKGVGQHAAPSATGFPDAPKPGWGKTVLGEICSDYGLDVDTVVRQLAEAGITAKPSDKVKEIGEANGIEPMEVFEALHEIATGK